MIECFVLWLLPPPPPPWGRDDEQGETFPLPQTAKEEKRIREAFAFPGKRSEEGKRKSLGFFAHSSKGKEEEEEELNKWLFPLFFLGEEEVFSVD